MTSKKDIEAQEKQRELDYQAVMDTQAGRRVMFEIIENCGVFRSSAGAAEHRTNETFFMEGARNEGLRLMGALQEYSPLNYGKMLQEARESK